MLGVLALILVVVHFMEHSERGVPPRARSASESSARRAAIAAVVALIAYIRVLALYIARRPAVIGLG